MTLTRGSQVQRRTGTNTGTGRIVDLSGTRAQVAWDASWRIGGGALTTRVDVADLVPAGDQQSSRRHRAALGQGEQALNPHARALAYRADHAARLDARADNHSEYRRVFDTLDSFEQELFARGYDAVIDLYRSDQAPRCMAEVAIREYLSGN